MNSDWAEEVYTAIQDSNFATPDNITQHSYQDDTLNDTVSYKTETINTPRVTDNLSDKTRRQTQIEVVDDTVRLHRIRNGAFIDDIPSFPVLKRILEEDIPHRSDYPIEWDVHGSMIYIDQPHSPTPVSLFPNQITAHWRTRDIYELESGEYRIVGGQIESEHSGKPSIESASNTRVQNILFETDWKCPECDELELGVHPDDASKDWNLQCGCCDAILRDDISFENLTDTADGTSHRTEIVEQFTELCF